MISWFDIEFTACHKPVKFSTGPHTKYTHWKQTVFYLKDVLTVEAGEQVKGMLSCAPNKDNTRDLDIGLEYETQTDDQGRSIGGKCEYKMC
jgi:protein arginine N-methyltransferase 1